MSTGRSSEPLVCPSDRAPNLAPGAYVKDALVFARVPSDRVCSVARRSDVCALGTARRSTSTSTRLFKSHPRAVAGRVRGLGRNLRTTRNRLREGFVIDAVGEMVLRSLVVVMVVTAFPSRAAPRVRLALGPVLTLAMLLATIPAAGWSCAPRDPREAPTEAMASGKWKVVEGVIEAESAFGLRFRVEHTYERTYAAQVARTITLPGQWNANRVGQPWTFYVQRTPIAYDYTDCGGSHPGLPTPDERSVLGAGLDPRPDEQGLGLIGNFAASGAVLVALTILISRRSRRGPPLTPAAAQP